MAWELTQFPYLNTEYQYLLNKKQKEIQIIVNIIKMLRKASMKGKNSKMTKQWVKMGIESIPNAK
jgi:hypothetical protein